MGACAGKTIESDDGASASGGSSGKPSKPAPAASPVTQCKTLASTWCNKAFGCYVKVGRIPESLRQTNVTECIKLFVEHAPCAEVTSVGAAYNQCLSQINAMDCKQWNVPQEQFGTIGERSRARPRWLSTNGLAPHSDVSVSRLARRHR